MLDDAEGVVGASVLNEEVDVAVVEESGGVEKGEAVFFFTYGGPSLIDGGKSGTEFAVGYGGLLLSRIGVRKINLCHPT